MWLSFRSTALIFVLMLCVCCLIASPLYSAPPSKAANDRAKAALALVTAKKGCGCGCEVCNGNCACTAGECGDPNCTCFVQKKEKNADSLDRLKLHRAMRVAERRDVPLVIWIQEACPPCERKLADCVHVHLSEYDGQRGLEKEPKVIVAKPDGEGGFDVLGRVDGLPTDLVDRVHNTLKRRAAPSASAPCYSCPPQMFAPPPMPMFFGGFGGFGGGGGCPGGGCGGGR